MYKSEDVSAADLDYIKKRIKEELTAGRTVRAPWLRQELLEERQVVVSRYALYHVLRTAGAEWGEAPQGKLNFDRDSSEQRMLRRNFLIKLAEGFQLEIRGDVILVWFDETYLNTGHVSKYTWYPSSLFCLHFVFHSLIKSSWMELCREIVRRLLSAGS